MKEGEIAQDSESYYRVTMGRHLRNGKLVPAVFSLGKKYSHAKIVKQSLKGVWMYPVHDAPEDTTRDTLYRSDKVLARVKYFVETSYNLSEITARLAAEKRQQANEQLRTAQKLQRTAYKMAGLTEADADADPVGPIPSTPQPVPEQHGHTFFGALNDYSDALDAKQISLKGEEVVTGGHQGIPVLCR